MKSVLLVCWLVAVYASSFDDGANISVSDDYNGDESIHFLHSHSSDQEVPTTVQIGDIARRKLSPEMLEALEGLPISPDRPEHFIHEPVQRALPPQQITDEWKGELTYYGHIAGASYCVPNNIQSWTCGAHCREAPGVSVMSQFHNPDTDIAGFVGRNVLLKEIYVSFRGSVSKTNWLSNFEVWRVFLPWTFSSHLLSGNAQPMVHDGFMDSYMSVRQALQELVINAMARHPDFTIRFMGHSLGGALATLAALDFEVLLEGRDIVYLTTYEAPRVGNADFAMLFQKYIPEERRRTRVTHGNDVVVHLPPYLSGYRHVAQEIFIPPATWLTPLPNGYVCDPVIGEDPRCSADYYGYSVEDHVYLPWGLVFGAPCDP